MLKIKKIKIIIAVWNYEMNKYLNLCDDSVHKTHLSNTILKYILGEKHHIYENLYCKTKVLDLQLA